MEWVIATEKLPVKEGYYKCLAMGFTKPIKCKFRKAQNGTKEWCPDYFIHKKRVPDVICWRK